MKMKISNANVFMPDGTFQLGTVEFDQRITSVSQTIEGGFDAEGDFLIPGLVDLHTHGAVDHDASDGDVEGLRAMAHYYAANGVTSFLATTMSLDEPRLEKAFRAAAAFQRDLDGARCVGIHMEGPFFSYEKRGSQAAKFLMPPDSQMFNRLMEASNGTIKLLSIAPECDPDFALIREASTRCHVSLAHTTATYALAKEAFAAGADHVTHLFNGMSFHHAEPGVAAAAAECGAYVEVVGDGNHLHPAVIRAIFRLYDNDKICIISDSLRCTGMPDGVYELGGQMVYVKDGRATIESGNLAGSSIHLMECVRRAVSYGIPLARAVAAASANPAAAIGMYGEIGVLQPGARADMVLLSPDLNVKHVFIDGTEYPA